MLKSVINKIKYVAIVVTAEEVTRHVKAETQPRLVSYDKS